MLDKKPAWWWWRTPILGAATSQKLGLITVHYDHIYSATSDSQATVKARADIVQRFWSVFSEELGEFTRDVSLETDLAIPAEQTPLRKVPLAMQDRLKAELARLEDIGLLKKVTTPTKWVSSMVVAEKKKDSQKIRLCIDPKPLNWALKRSIYPLPTLEDVLPKLAKAKVFSVCDLRNGFWHCKLDEESSLLTTFNTPHIVFGGHGYHSVCCQHLKYSRGNWQSNLKGWPETQWLQRILTFWCLAKGRLRKRHLHTRQELGTVIAESRRERKQGQRRKIQIPAVWSLLCRRHTVQYGSKSGPQENRSNLQYATTRRCGRSKTLWGMANYLGICKALRQLTRQNVQWEWSHEQARVFDQIKKKIASTPILVYFDPKKTIKVQCDSSQQALGAALMQDEHVVAFASRSLTDTERTMHKSKKSYWLWFSHSKVWSLCVWTACDGRNGPQASATNYEESSPSSAEETRENAPTTTTIRHKSDLPKEHRHAFGRHLV